jgi:hypothetical protein
MFLGSGPDFAPKDEMAFRNLQVQVGVHNSLGDSYCYSQEPPKTEWFSIRGDVGISGDIFYCWVNSEVVLAPRA